jgi:hypothetical protein
LLRVFHEVEKILPRLKSVAEVRALARVVEGMLTTHGELETKFAFVALDHAQHDKRRLTTLHEDHQELDGRLRRVQEARSCERARRLFRAALRATRAHFREEERKLFPALERELGVGSLRVLGRGFKKAARAQGN